MRFMESIEAKYKVCSSDLKDQILKLTQEIMGLGYDDKTEGELLSVLRNAYDNVAQACVTADSNWDAAMKANWEKKNKMKEDRKRSNEKVLKDYRMKQGGGNMLDDAPRETPKVKEQKKKVADSVKEMGKVIEVDFTKKKPSGSSEHPLEVSKDERDAKTKRIQESLQKVHQLMTEMKKV